MKVKRCKKCGRELITGKSQCVKCMEAWSDMRVSAFKYVKQKFQGDFKDIQPLRIKEMHRLEKVWKKSPDKFLEIVSVR